MAKAKKRKKSSFFKVFMNLKSYLNIVYLLLLFPLGIISFIVTLLTLTFSISLIITPIFAITGNFNLGTLPITSYALKFLISLILCIVGIFLLTLSLYVLNGLSFIYKKLLGLFR